MKKDHGIQKRLLKKGKIMRPQPIGKKETEVSRRRSQKELILSESRYRRLFETAQDGILILDAETGRIEDANPFLIEMLGTMHEELLGKKLWEIGLFKDRQAARDAFSKLRNGYIRYKDLPLVKKNGRIMNVEFISNVYHIGRKNVIQCNICDITKHKRLAKNLEESENQFQRIVQDAPTAIFIQTRSRFAFVNSAALRLFGAATADQLIGRPVLDRFLSNFHEAIKERIRLLNQEKEKVPMIEEIYLKLDGTPVNVEVSAVPIVYQEENGALVFVRDITERKRAEEALLESEARYRNLIETARDIVFTISPQGFFTSLNRASETITGWQIGEWIGKPFLDLMEPEAAFMSMERFRALMTGQLGEAIEVRLRKKNGDRIPVEIFAGPQMKEGKIVGILGIARDISHRKQAEEQIRKSLSEKELLLREIHHRVNNNMQIIISLLNLQADQTGNKAFRELLKVSQSRIRSMALVHEKLYASQDLARIDFSDYIKNLAVHLFQFNQANPDLIRLRTGLEGIFLEIQTAIPCGLILNELITNSIKHAFPRGRGGEIAVEFRAIGHDTYRMTVKDDGVGIPKDLDVRKTKTFGLQVVALLAKQLEADIEVQREEGTAFSITFKELKYKPRF